VAKITDSDVAFNLSYNYTTPAQGSCSSEIYPIPFSRMKSGTSSGWDTPARFSAYARSCRTVVASDDVSNALYNCTLVEGGGGCKPAGQTCNANDECCSTVAGTRPENLPLFQEGGPRRPPRPTCRLHWARMTIAIDPVRMSVDRTTPVAEALVSSSLTTTSATRAAAAVLRDPGGPACARRAVCRLTCRQYMPDAP
jgi:hypothetical protein